MSRTKRVLTFSIVPAALLVLALIVFSDSSATGYQSSSSRATHVPANFNELAGPQDMVMMPSEVLDPNPESVRLRFWDPPLETNRVSINGIEYSTVRLAGEGSTVEPGEPDLPHVTRLVMIGKTGNAAVRILDQSYSVTSNMKIAPRQILHGDENYPLDGVVQPKSSAYSEDKWLPENVVEITEPATLRDVRFVVVSVSPVQYNPARNEIRVYDNIECVVENTGGQGPNEIHVSPRSISPGFKKLYETFENFRGSSLDELPVFPGSYLVISTNDAIILSQAQLLVDWYTRKGLNAYNLTIPLNESANDVRTLINNEYNNGNGELEFVCLLGDPSASTSSAYYLPTHEIYLVEEYDNFFATLNSGGGENPDPVPDLAVGRISVQSSSDLAPCVKKSINYKKTPYTGDSDWFTTAYCAAHTGHVHSNISTKEYTRQIMLQNGITCPPVEHFPSDIDATDINSILNTQISVFNHRMSWLYEMYNSALNSAPSNIALPFVISFTCGTGNFASSGDALSEEWLHPSGQSTSNLKGAIGCVGLYGSGTHVPYNNIVDAGSMYGIYALGIEEQGLINIAGKLELYKNYQNFLPSSVEDFCWWANLIGDPAVQIWRKQPVTPIVNMPSTIALNTNNVTLELLTPTSNPIEGALICFVKDYSGSETFSRGYTDANGLVNLPITTTSTGYLQVTVTKDDVMTIVDSIQVVSTAASLALNSVSIDDDNSGGTSGNNDDIPNPGEIIDLNIRLKNAGTSATCTGISGILTTEAAGVTIIESTRDYPDIAYGENAYPTSPYRIQVSSVFNGEPITLFLETTSSAGMQSIRVDMTPSAADVAYISSAFFGPGNNLNPGESGPFQVTFQNSGDETLVNASGLLRSLDARVTVTDQFGDYGNVSSSSNATNSVDRFEISISSGMFNGHQTEMELVITDDNGFRDSTRFHITIGSISSTSPSGPDAYGYYAFDNTETSPPTAPCTYEWIEICPSLGGSGTSMGFNDQVEDGDQSSVVTLPFSFQFYGNTFSQITICTNGWIAFGSYPTIDDFRNYRMGTPLGPPNQVAAFWDDLEVFGTSNNVYRYHDSADHRYIIEWRARTLWSDANEFFQIILYDPNYYPSTSGDGKIKVQYHTFNLTANSATNDNSYFSVGIQNQDHSIGLDYAFWSSYGPGAASLAAGRAIMFTTDATGQLNPAIELNDPNGGENWYVGLSRNILWQTTAVTGDIDIELNRGYPGGPWESVVSETDNDGTYAWTIDAPETSTARIRVLSHDNPSVGDTSDANFNLLLPSLTITSPNGGEILNTGETYDIMWSGSGLASVTVEINRNYPSENWELITASAEGRYEWTATGPPTGNARIRVTSNTVPTVFDITDGSFVIGLPPVVSHQKLSDQSIGTATLVANIVDDAAGINATLYYREIGATSYSSTSFIESAYPDDYTASFNVPLPGEYEYYIQTVDAQGFVVRTPETGTLSFDAGDSCTEWLSHDDGVSESYQWANGPHFQWAVYFDPGSYPYTICSGCYAINPVNPTALHGPILFSILLADGPLNEPGTVIFQDTTGSVNAAGGLPSGAAWTDVVVSGETDIIATGPFYVSVMNFYPADGAVAFALDTNSPSDHSYIFDPCDDVWMNESETHLNTRYGNRMIRVAGFGLQPPLIVIQRENDGVKLSWNTTGAPYYRIYSSANADGPFDTFVGSTDELEFIDAGVLATDEILFYQVLSSTTP
ncbi:hypothetical protein KKC97_03625 [bacterium]|nr:hypothetical protein [bacterium]MBU1636735.1 hypothetical protein [bacterium]